ncbi:REPTOR-binding partner isoform X1 [Dermacentor variabilis]|uniref:REPTOR-binding partner isoform X1 n=2 Tax=Dermacentor variabilis TaxID=34621 RepID=UPI003F5C6A2D
MQMETAEYDVHYVKRESVEEEGHGGRRGRRSSGSSVGTSATGGGGRSSGSGSSGSKRGDMRAKLERSRQSARECRARKKLRYQYLEELVADREKAVLVLRHELDLYQQYFKEMDQGNIPQAVLEILEREHENEQQIPQQD